MIIYRSPLLLLIVFFILSCNQYIDKRENINFCYKNREVFGFEEIYAFSNLSHELKIDGKEKYFLVVLTHSKGINFTSVDSFFNTLYGNSFLNKAENTIGHSWMMLIGDGKFLECGQTGEFGVIKHRYHEGVLQLIRDNNPNPISWLWEVMPDGKFHKGSNGYKPTYACSFSISKEQYIRLFNYIDNYDYANFSIINKTCTTFVVNALKIIGINLGHRVTIKIPQEYTFSEKPVMLWTNPKYSTLIFGSPDVLEKSLEEAVKKNLGKDVLDWYLN
jgi:hypothetical protein